MWYVCETGEVHIGCWWRDLRERDRLENLETNGKTVLQWIFKVWNGEP